MDATLGDATTTWALLRTGRVTGRGQVAPRLAFEIYARTPRERIECQIHFMHAELVAGGEILGDGVITGVAIYHSDYPLTIEIPVNRAALGHLDQLATGQIVELGLRLPVDTLHGPAREGSIRLPADSLDRWEEELGRRGSELAASYGLPTRVGGERLDHTQSKATGWTR